MATENPLALSRLTSTLSSCSVGFENRSRSSAKVTPVRKFRALTCRAAAAHMVVVAPVPNPVLTAYVRSSAPGSARPSAAHFTARVHFATASRVVPQPAKPLMKTRSPRA